MFIKHRKGFLFDNVVKGLIYYEEYVKNAFPVTESYDFNLLLIRRS